MKIDADDPRLTAYVFGDLDDAERDEVRESLAADEAVRRATDAIHAAVDGVTASLAAARPLGLTDSQRRAVIRAARESAGASRRSVSLRPWPTAVASLILSGFLLFFIRVPGLACWFEAVWWSGSIPADGLARYACDSQQPEPSVGQLLTMSVVRGLRPPNPFAGSGAESASGLVASEEASRSLVLPDSVGDVEGMAVAPAPPRAADGPVRQSPEERRADASQWPEDVLARLAREGIYLPNREGLENGAYAAIIAADRATAAAVSPNQAAERTFDRTLVFRAAMRMQVHNARSTIDRARVWVEARGGFLESSSVVDGPDGGRGSAVLRVPREAFEATRQFLRGLSFAVVADESTREDLTGQYADMAAQLANLETAETEVRKLLESLQQRGGSLDDVVKLHDELVRRRGEIDAMRARLDALADQAALSTITIELEPVPPPTVTPTPTATPIPPASWSPRPTIKRASGDLTRFVQGLADVTLYLGIVLLPPLALFWGALWIALRGLASGRRRDRADAEVS